MKNFNVRVYGILIHDNKVLVSDEHIKGMNITKFPGGGLEFGEGTIDCVIREFKEELGLDVEVISHFYTTDFYIASAFNANDQLISVYFVMEKQNLDLIPVSESKNDIPNVDGAQIFRWISIDTISENDFTFPIDKLVAKKLQQTFILQN